MCTSWPVTPSSCLTSASLWPPRAPRAWPWPPHPAPPTAAPQTEPTPLNWLNHLKEWVGAVSPRPNSIPPCHEEPKRKKSDDGKGWVRSHGRVWKGDPRHPSSLSCPPTQAYLSSSLSQKGDIVLGVKALDDLHSRGRSLAPCWWKVGFSVWDFLFCLKKEKIRSIELLQLGLMGKDCRRLNTHTHSHIHPCMSHPGPR